MSELPLITIVMGTRPEAIKLAPVILALKDSNKVQIRVILTGQHKEMIAQVMIFFGLKEDIDLNLMEPNQTLTHITCKVLNGLEEEFSYHRPDLLLVQGDTSTAFSAALSAFYKKIPVAHIEAGLRTNNLYKPFPEEANRRLISQISSLHFAPTEISYKNLIQSGVNGEVFLTGNTIIDSLKITEKKIQRPYKYDINWEVDKVILTTIHRRENWGDSIIEISKAIIKIIEMNKNIIFILPMHKNKRIREPLIRLLGNNSRVKLIEPLSYKALISMMKYCYLILTDSGGIQEEAPTFGKPVLVLRETTERVEAIQAGSAKLVGTNKKLIIDEVNNLLKNNNDYKTMSEIKNPFGDGFSSKRILDACINFLNKN